MKLVDIIALPPDERVTRLFRRLIPLAEGDRYARLPLPARHVFVVVEWLGETRNGGARQYFSNSSGGRWSDARFAFDVVGAGGDVFARALLAFAGGAPPSHPRARVAATADVGAALDAVDGAIDRAAVVAAVAAYIVAERDALAFVDRYPSGLKALDVDDDAAAFAAYVAGADVGAVDDAFVVVTWAAFLWRPLRHPSAAQARFLSAFDALDEASVDGVGGYKKTASGAHWRSAADALDDAGAGVFAAAVRGDDDAAVQGARVAAAKALARVVKGIVAVA